MQARQGFFSEAEKQGMKRTAAQEMVKPCRDNMTAITIGVALLCAFAAKDYGLLGCVIAAGIGAGLSCVLTPKILDKVEDSLASAAVVKEKVYYYRA